MTAGIAVARWSRRAPNATALFDGEQRVTWRALDDRTSRLAKALMVKYQVGPGGAVALLSENRIAVPEVLAGVHKAGGVYVGLNFRFDEQELESALVNANPRVLIISADLIEQGRAVADRLGVQVLALDDPGPSGYEALLAAADALPPSAGWHFEPGESACIVYTSGTTGRPKGIILDHAAMMQHATVACLEYEITAETRYLVQIPHNSSVNITIVPCLLAGAALGFADNRQFSPDAFAEAVVRNSVTHTFLVPTQLMRILDQISPVDTRLASLETIGYGSSPIAPERLRELIVRFGPIFIQLYGMAEIASIGTLLRKHDHLRALTETPRLLLSCGQPSYAVDARVLDDRGQEAAPEERGEVVFRGMHLMSGYHKDSERTSEALVDGSIYSGDIAMRDEEGFLYIVDRMKNLIIRGGQNIVPTEIENVLYGHPAVSEAAVIGAPDPIWGERIVSVVALRANRKANEAEILAFVKASSLARFKRPEEVLIVESLPKNPVGKIDKRDIRSWFWQDGRAV